MALWRDGEGSQGGSESLFDILDSLVLLSLHLCVSVGFILTKL